MSLPTVATRMHNAACSLKRISGDRNPTDRQASAADKLPVIVSSEAAWHDLSFPIIFCPSVQL
jgi:hypothetical protein